MISPNNLPASIKSQLIVIKIGTAIWFAIMLISLIIHKDVNVIYISAIGTLLGLFGHFYSAKRLNRERN
jgi:hypothetical protein